MTTSPRIHISKDGKPRPCDAQPGGCRLGGDHYATMQDAMEGAILAQLEKNSSHKVTPRMSTLARLNVLDQSPEFLTQCAFSDDQWVVDKVAGYPQPLPEKAVLGLLGADHEVRSRLAHRHDLSPEVMLLLASDRDPSVREELISAQDMDTLEHRDAFARVQNRRFEDARWLAEARISHPSPVIRQAAIASLPVSSQDAKTVFGPAGDDVWSYNRAAVEASQDDRNDFVASYRALEDETARVEYYKDLAEVAKVAVKFNRVREFQNARQVGGDVGAVLSVHDLLPDGVGVRVLRPAKQWLPEDVQAKL